MAKISLKATGGLNKDFDPNNLPQGDYSSASNIVFDSGKSGGAGAIRLMESIISSGITITGIKATFQDVDGSIYVLGDNGSTASIYKIPTTLDSKSTVLTYSHSISGTIIPDLKIIGKVLVWNYAENGTVLSFSLDETFGNTFSIADLKLAKPVSANVVSIQKAIGTGLDFLEANDFQFASRYQYKTKEYSSLSNYSQIYKGEKGTASYTLSYNFTGRPVFSEKLEVYVRIGNDGIWRRIDTQICDTYTDAFVWFGQTYESLDTITTGKPFDAVPVYAKHIEIAKNRIFLANIKDDYDISESNLSFTITANTGYTLPSGGSYNSYISGSPLTDAKSSETSTSGTDYAKPFANNSTYAIGLAYYDAALKTRGVEKYTKFNTGNFAYPIIPTITIGLSGWSAPAWAKYAQLVYTKNLNKSYFYEGYASNIFFELNSKETNEVTKEVTDKIVVSQSITADQLKDIRFLVVDLMGMYRANRIYVFQDGDRINLNTPNGILNLKIAKQENTLLYCEYAVPNGVTSTMTNVTIPVPKNNYFEIYTKREIQEEESLIFYEYGNLMPLSGWVGQSSINIKGDGTLNASTESKLIGDTVFSKFEMPVYKTAPFLYNVSRTVPATLGSGIVEDVITVVNANINSLASSTVGAGNPNPKIDTSVIANIPSGTNGDGASITDSNSAFKIAGFYDIGVQKAGVNTLSIVYNLRATKVLSINPDPAGSPAGSGTGSLTFSLAAQVYKIPYNNTKNAYDSAAEKVGKPYYIFSQVSKTTDGTSTEDSSSTPHIIQLSTDITKPLEANDKFYIEFSLTFVSEGSLYAAQVSIASNSTYAITMTLKGNRTTPKVTTSYNQNVEIDSTQVKYIVRSPSNAIANPYWNTSAGKPSFLSLAKISAYRTNTIRYGGNYVAGTNINDISSFFSLDSNDVPIENGEITSVQRASRLQGNGAMLLVLCQKESSYIMLGEQELSQGNNSSIRSLTANMIGTIRNFNNNLGMQDKGSVMNYKGNIWWWDNFNKKIIKYTPEGLEIVSDVYMKSHFLTKSGVATFSYDPFYNMCFVGIGDDTVSTGYSDNLKRWVAEYSFRSDYAESYGDKIIIFKNSVVYKPVANTVTNDYNNLVGNSVNGSITFVINSKLPVNPLNVAVWHNMNVIDWTTSNYVKSNLLTIGITNENNQSTNIVESNFLMEDNRLYAHVLRNINSYRAGVLMTNAIIEGDYIVGYLNKFVVTLKDKTQNMRINSIDVELAPVSGHS